jgi:hypothetical protein
MYVCIHAWKVLKAKKYKSMGTKKPNINVSHNVIRQYGDTPGSVISSY